MTLAARLKEALRQAQELLELERLCREAAEHARSSRAPRLDLRSTSDEEVLRSLEPLPQR